MNSAARSGPFVPQDLASCDRLYGACRLIDDMPRTNAMDDRRAARVALSLSRAALKGDRVSKAVPGRPSPVTGARVTALIVVWFVVVLLAAPSLHLYYEARAAGYVVPPLVLIYAYCLSHRRRATALLALVATVVAVLAIGLAAVIPKATSAVALASRHHR
jgi:hypothetical protein